MHDFMEREARPTVAATEPQISYRMTIIRNLSPAALSHLHLPFVSAIDRQPWPGTFHFIRC